MTRTHEITLNRVPVAWDLDAGNLEFYGMQSVLFWANPTLYLMFKPLVEAFGVDMFRLLVAHEASKRAEADYRSIVTQFGSTFAEGFVAWGAALSVAGWGRFELLELDTPGRAARVKLHDPWELKMLRGTGERWGCPFLQGKITGVFSHAFGVPCWADEENLILSEDELSVELRIYEVHRTIADELRQMREDRRDERERALRASVERATRELQDKLELVERQRAEIMRLSTPLIQVWDGVFVLPLIGELDEARAGAMTTRSLTTIDERGAQTVIIDLTGVTGIDAEAAQALMRTVAAARLLGARCLLSGTPAAVARTLVETDAALLDVPSFSTVQAALQQALNLHA